MSIILIGGGSCMRQKIWSMLLLCLFFMSIIPIVVSDSQVWENEYGRLEVYPSVSRNLIRQRQWYNASWYKTGNYLDIAFCFNESLSYGKVFYWNGTGYNPVNVNHVEYNGKHYYVLENIFFEQDETKHGYWEYDTPLIDNHSSGKWDMYIKLHSDSWQYAISNGRIVHLDPWWDSDWGFKKEITIDHDQVPNILVNFPVLINLSSDGDLVSNIGFSDGRDIAFTDWSESVQLNHEIEFFDDSTGQLVIWVNVTQLNSSSDTSIFMYYGNTGCSNQSNPSGVWDSNYLAVWHMNSTFDSTGNNVDLTNTGVSFTSGNVHLCGDFESSEDDHLQHGSFLDTMPSSDILTLECWINPESDTSDYQSMISKTNTNDEDRIYFRRNTGTDYLDLMAEASNGGIKVCTGSVAMSDSFWHYTVGFYDASVALRHMLNGTIETSGNIVGAIRDDNDQPFCIGCRSYDYGGPDNWRADFDGLIDEIRISDIIRNNSWIETTYNTIVNFVV